MEWTPVYYIGKKNQQHGSARRRVKLGRERNGFESPSRYKEHFYKHFKIASYGKKEVRSATHGTSDGENRKYYDTLEPNDNGRNMRLATTNGN